MNHTLMTQVRSNVSAFLREIHDVVIEDDGRRTVRKGNARDRSRLKRISEPAEAMAMESVQHLFSAADGRARAIASEDARTIACLAMLLASVPGGLGAGAIDKGGRDRSGDIKAITQLGARAGGKKHAGSPRRVSELRFGKLIRARDPKRRLDAFRALIQLISVEGSPPIDPYAIAYGFLNWTEPAVQFAFARGYFAQGSLADGSAIPPEVDAEAGA